MGYNRFLFLLNCIRFEDKATREDQRKFDKLAPIRFIIDSFVKNCVVITIHLNLLQLMRCCTVSEADVLSYNTCLTNRAKYSLKMFAMCERKRFIIHNLEVYCCKQPPGQYEASNSGLDIVKRLVIPIEKSNRNVTAN